MLFLIATLMEYSAYTAVSYTRKGEFTTYIIRVGEFITYKAIFYTRKREFTTCKS